MASRTARQDAPAGPHGRRLRAALVCGLAIWGFVAVRLVLIQIVHAPRLAGYAERQQVAETSVASERGTIYDRNLVPLTDNLTVPSACAYPREIDSPRDVARGLRKVLGGSLSDHLAKVTADRNFVWIERQLAPEVADRLAALDLPGIGFINESKRIYPFGRQLCHVIGMTDVDGRGISGVECEMDRLLTGSEETVYHFLDSAGRRTPTPACTKIVPKDGMSVVLTIDLDLQGIAEVELERGVRENGAKGGIVIIQNPWTGEILAMANEPTFDPNCPGRYSVECQKNRAVTDQYEPGSTFKVITACAALSTGAADMGSVYYAGQGLVRFESCTIHDVTPHGWLDLPWVLVLSSNTGAAQIAEAVGKVGLYSFARDFGFGCLTGIALPGEVRGMLREPSEWSRRSVYTIGIGQEIAVTALQLVGAYSVVANGGYLMDPQITKAVLEDDGRVVERARWNVVRQVVDPAVATTVQEILHDVTEVGTGRNARVEGTTVAGKTGTAQKVVPGIRGFAPGKFVSSFVGFAPADDPQLVCLVVIDEPEGRGLGGEVAAPVFARIIERIVRGPQHDYVLADDVNRVELVPASKGGTPRGLGVPLASAHFDAQRAVETWSRTETEIVTADGIPEDGIASAAVDEGEGVRGSARLPTGATLPPIVSPPLSDEPFELPDLRGMSLRQARRIAAAGGLALTIEGSGTVKDQSPRPGANVRPGDRVVARCSSG